MGRKPKEIRMARRLGIDLIAIGLAMANRQVQNKLHPNDMSTQIGRKLLTAIKEQDRDGFRSVLANRFGVAYDPVAEGDKPPHDAIVNYLLFDNAKESALDAIDIILEQVEDEYTLEDIRESLEKSLHAVNRAVKAAEETTTQV